MQHVNLLVVLRRKLPAGRVEGFPRLHCLLKGVAGLGQQGLLSHHISALNDQAEGVSQLNRYGTNFLLAKKRWGIGKL